MTAIAFAYCAHNSRKVADIKKIKQLYNSR
jgi:hypothetical protein